MSSKGTRDAARIRALEAELVEMKERYRVETEVSKALGDEVELLSRERGELPKSVQKLLARTQGAEAERDALKARVAELENEVHLTPEYLRKRLLMGGGRESDEALVRVPARVKAAANPAARKARETEEG